MTTKVIDGLDLSSQKIVNLADGAALSDAATWGQVQAYLTGLAWKASVRAASTANVTLASPGASIDGVALVAQDRVLLKNQTNGYENGIYVWTAAASPLTRASDMDSAAETKAATVLVTEGTVNADTAWTQTADNITLGTTTLSFVAFGATPASYTAGTGLQLSGQTFSVKLPANSGLIADGTGLYVDVTKVVRKYAGNVGDGTSTTINVAHNLATTDVQYSLKDTGSSDFVLMKATTIDTNTLRFVFPTAPASNAYRVVVQG